MVGDFHLAAFCAASASLLVLLAVFELIMHQVHILMTWRIVKQEETSGSSICFGLKDIDR